MVTKENQIILNAFEHEKFFMEELRGTYSYYLNRGYAIEFLTDEQILDGSCNQYEIIHAPLMSHFPEKLASGVEKYIEQGGKFISSARLGYVGEYGWVEFHYPSGELHKPAGFEVFELKSDIDPEIAYNDKTVVGNWHKERIKIASDNVRVVAKYADDDEPAVVESKIGKGSFLYFGTHFGRAFLNETGLENVLNDYLKLNDIKPLVQLNCNNTTMRKTIQYSVLEKDNRAMIFVTNYANKAQRKVLGKNGHDTTITVHLNNVKSVKSMDQEKELTFKETEDGISFNVSSNVDQFDIYDIQFER